MRVQRAGLVLIHIGMGTWGWCCVWHAMQLISSAFWMTMVGWWNDVVERTCGTCSAGGGDVVRDVLHVAACPADAHERAAVCTAILDDIRDAGGVGWVGAYRARHVAGAVGVAYGLLHMLCGVFGLRSGELVSGRCMWGGWTWQERDRARRLVGVVDGNAWERVVHGMRGHLLRLFRAFR